jgi:hypothetical protein
MINSIATSASMAFAKSAMSMSALVLAGSSKQPKLSHSPTDLDGAAINGLGLNGYLRFHILDGPVACRDSTGTGLPRPTVK